METSKASRESWKTGMSYRTDAFVRMLVSDLEELENLVAKLLSEIEIYKAARMTELVDFLSTNFSAEVLPGEHVVDATIRLLKQRIH